MSGSGRDGIGFARRQQLFRRRRAHLDPQTTAKTEIPIGDLAVKVPRNHVTGRKGIKPRSEVAAISYGFDIFYGVARG